MDSSEYTQKRIAEDLLKLGVKTGDTLFLRISYKAIGKIEGGPVSFIKALESVVGNEGTIIMTAFPRKHIRQLRWLYRNDVHSKDNIAKPATGIIPTLALTLPESRISEKLEFPFVVIGKEANYLTSHHTHEKYGYWLLQEAIEKFGCKCLRIGGEPFLGSTHIAFDHVLIEKGYSQKKIMKGLYLNENGKKIWREQPGTIFCRSGFKKYVSEIVNASLISKGKVGNGEAFITDMTKSLEKELQLFRKDITLTLCDDPDCLHCRTSFSFSNGSNWSFFCRQVKMLFTPKRRKAIVLLKRQIENLLFGIRVQ